MATMVQTFREEPHQCPYLPEQTAALDVRVLLDVTPAELAFMLVRGWRRFGPAYFRPACAACVACEPLRIPSATFLPSTSQRRAHRKAARLTRTVSSPVVDEERMALYDRWHAQREDQRGWEPSRMTAERYAFEFAYAHPSVREVTFRDPADHDRLVGLGIVDEVPDALSAVFFFWDPGHAPASLGVAHVVMLVDDAAARGLDCVYLGFRVAACQSLAYKGSYNPHETLEGRPGPQQRPMWSARVFESRAVGPSSATIEP